MRGINPAAIDVLLVTRPEDIPFRRMALGMSSIRNFDEQRQTKGRLNVIIEEYAETSNDRKI